MARSSNATRSRTRRPPSAARALHHALAEYELKAYTIVAGHGRSARSSLDDRSRGSRPARSLRRVDGWFTVALVVLICLTLAWSLDDALLVLGRDE